MDFAYPGEEPEWWSAHLEWSATAIVLTGGAVPDSELDARVREKLHQYYPQPPLLQPSRQLPASRRPPATVSPLNHYADPRAKLDLVLPIDTEADVELWFSNFEIYDTGVMFDLRSRNPDGGRPDTGGRDAINLGHRIGAGSTTRVRLVVASPPSRHPSASTGWVLSNSFSPNTFPDDDTAPWLSGLFGSRSHAKDAGVINARGKYFLSPTPTQGTIFFTVAYPEFGISATTVELDAAQLAP